MLKPKALRPGDTVAIVSLSSGMAGEAPFLPRFRKGCRRLEEEFSLQVKVMPHTLKGIDYLYRHPEKRAQDLMDAFQDPEVAAVICAIGGDDAVRLLPYMDFEVLRDHPKIFMGYSDSTANHFMLYKAGVTSYHGPCVMVEFAENVSMHSYTRQSILDTLFHPQARTEIRPSPFWTSRMLEWADPANDNVPREMTQDTRGFELLQGEGTAHGALLGGNISVMQMIIGTSIWPDAEQWRDKLLFLETAEDYPAPEQITYFLRNLAAQGILERINGIIVGKPLDEQYYEEYKDVYRKVVGIEAGRPSLPILYNVNCSHTAPVAILPYGVEAEIDCSRKSLALLEHPTLP